MNQWRLSLLALLMACGTAPSHPTGGSWAVTTRVTLPTGAALQPDDPGKPGIAASQAVAFADGKAFAVLANLAEFKPAGPSFLSVHDGVTLAREQLVPLKLDAARCANAGFAITAGESILVACAGEVSLSANKPTTDGALAVVSAADNTVRQIVIVGGSPGSALKVGNEIWLGDLESPALLRVDATTGAVKNGLGADAPATVCRSGYVSALADIAGRTFASCFNDDAVQEFDPTTGAKIGAAIPTGDGPVHMASFLDRITVVDSLAGTLSFLMPTTPATVEKHAVHVAGEQGGNDVEGIAGNDEWAAAADSGFGTLAIFDVKQDFRLVDAVDVKTSASAPTNDPYGVAMGDGAFFVAIAGWTQPGELVRVGRSAQ